MFSGNIFTPLCVKLETSAHVELAITLLLHTIGIFLDMVLVENLH